MKKLRNLIALTAVFAMAAFLTGCGDDNDDDDNNGGQAAGPAFAPATTVEFQNNTYTVDFGNGQNAQLTFPTAGTYSLTSGGVTETGVITGLTRNGENYIATLTPTDNNGRVRAGELRVAFTQKTANSFAGQITIQEQGGAQTYPFSATVNSGGTTQGGTTQGGTTQGGTTQGGTTQGGTTQGGTTDGGTTQGGTTQGGTTDGGTTQGGTTQGGTTSGGGSTTPPTTLTGKTLQITYGTIGGEKFMFTSETAAIYEDGPQTFSYSWDLANTRIVGTRRDAGGNVVANYDIDLTFNANSGTAGTAVVIYQEPGGQAATDAATFTLTP